MKLFRLSKLEMLRFDSYVSLIFLFVSAILTIASMKNDNYNMLLIAIALLIISNLFKYGEKDE